MFRNILALLFIVKAKNACLRGENRDLGIL